jgi:hypothetical protein
MSKDNELEAISAIIVVIILIILLPLLTYWFGYFDGWLAMKTVGNPLITSINEVFGTSFSVTALPKIGGALGWIGGFFKSADIFKRKGE